MEPRITPITRIKGKERRRKERKKSLTADSTLLCFFFSNPCNLCESVVKKEKFSVFCFGFLKNGFPLLDPCPWPLAAPFSLTD